jgi:hypothetical protein
LPSIVHYSPSSVFLNPSPRLPPPPLLSHHNHQSSSRITNME